MLFESALELPLARVEGICSLRGFRPISDAIGVLVYADGESELGFTDDVVQRSGKPEPLAIRAGHSTVRPAVIRTPVSGCW